MTGEPGLMSLRTAPSASRARRRLPNERLLYGAIGFIGVLLVWQLASDFGLVRKLLLSSPLLILQSAITDLGGGEIWSHISTSLGEWIVGFAAAIVVGVPLGMAIGLFRRLDYLLSLWLTAAYNTPVVALVPLIVLLFGIGLESKVIVVFLIAVFSILLSTEAGVRSVDWRHREIARSFDAWPALVMRSVILPATFPFILTGLRVGAGRALVGVVVAEFTIASEGLGFYISFNASMIDTARMFVGIWLFGIFGVAMGEIIRRVEQRFDVWRPEIG